MTGPNQDDTWDITGANAGDIVGAVTSFVSIQELNGGTGADAFVFADKATVAGKVDGGAGKDALDFTAYLTNLVTTLTGFGPVDGFMGTMTGLGKGFTNIDAVYGGHAGDTLNGLDQNSAWHIDADSQYQTGGRTLGFRAFEVVNGGSANDDFTVVGAPAPITLNGNGGDDFFGVTNVTNIEAILTVNGGGQAGDRLVLDDSAGLAARVVSFTDTQVGALPGDAFFGPGGFLNYFRIQSVLYLGGGFRNTVNLLSKVPGTALDLDTGAGADVITVLETPGSDYFNVLVDGQAGDDTLRVVDVTGSGVMKNIPAGPGAGDVMTCYLGGAQSFIDYQNVEHVITSQSADQSFVQSLYHEFLLRNASQDEVDAWVAVLNGGGSRTLVAADIIRSREARDLLVKGWYVHYLGRTADGGEESPWVDLLLQGQTEEKVLATILNSDEYYFRAGGTDQGFVNQLFRDGLGRDAEADAVFAYTMSIHSQIGRGGAAFSVLNSVEYRTDFVIVVLYGDELGRSEVAPPGVRFPGLFARGVPSVDEVNAWVFSHLDLTTLRIAFASTEEFFERAC